MCHHKVSLELPSFIKCVFIPKKHGQLISIKADLPKTFIYQQGNSLYLEMSALIRLLGDIWYPKEFLSFRIFWKYQPLPHPMVNSKNLCFYVNNDLQASTTKNPNSLAEYPWDSTVT